MMDPEEDVNEDQEEGIEDVAEEIKAKDPYRNAEIVRKVDGKELRGVVVEIEQGAETKELLYRVQYEDGDLEHMVRSDLVGFMVSNEEPPAALPKAVAKKPAAAKAAPAAAKSKAKAKAAPKGKAKAQPKGKAKAKAKPKAKSASAPKAKAKAVVKKPAKK
mmetsp:Transcript_57566/g.136914  ORF Transcript_57566/g.136914 Transcript_57566/m.136914 type:complete len:161 (-) Transcript_57566:187-669(-)|eukprot:CAMPEP_0178442198 /NCGR_PEP_ID=MMETSP0689_2-20121128/38007_1 /TAXON_ID=160604 /ORGANISM="Amphidinium massartii, Strain CS-259" /LENGTH=160 /DNA_ID=CAMNT_0020065669 /DNA_START=115 /DNA_END=597 /DNA_ORIENTATION=-